MDNLTYNLQTLKKKILKNYRQVKLFKNCVINFMIMIFMDARQINQIRQNFGMILRNVYALFQQ